ncbi:glucoamylase family protein [Opitutus sp. ER46]|uniref:glucoamylase family protein n=1 Tax=Opitutus sp. ER46 TaxID=2161864 RepID=UPI000D3276AD|nr:glucoamylase family protein [Opitutus sp. ER46]PTX92267.1 hypothetical protein DB354_13025 [Opitutus sp. ER46]
MVSVAVHPSSVFRWRAIVAAWSFRVLAMLTLGALPSAVAAPLAPAPWPGARAAALLGAEDDALLDDMQRAAFRFFDEQSHPVTGLIRDRARADGSPSEGKASISASGFALSGWVIATHRGWVGRTEALERVRSSLRFLATKAQREHGFFYHFMEMDTGERTWKCELSSIDSALFLAGAIVAREYFQDPEITRLVNQLYTDMDWKWFQNDGEIVSLSWHPETGFSRYRWMNYSEHLMMSFLALGAPEHGLDARYWRAWSRVPVGSYAGYHYIQQAPLFVHQFTHSYADFRDRRDAFADYYQNSVLATLAQRQFCIDLRREYPSWSERLWGITASDSATGYKAWGGPPRTLQLNALDGTIVPCAAAGSVPFAPYETLLTLRHMRAVYGDKIWQRYGFVDAFNPQTGWVNPDVIGIDQGITLVQAENARSGLIWALFMQAPEVQKAMRKAGLVSKNRLLSLDNSRFVRALGRDAWLSVADLPPAPETAGLQLTAILAAHALGLLSTDETLARTHAFLAAVPAPTADPAVGQYAAALITLRRALPALETEASTKLKAIDWRKVTLQENQLGSASRLTAFLQIAVAGEASTVWSTLRREAVKVGPIHTLAPSRTADQFIPGLWLDEHAIITGASASQLAYATFIADTEGPQPPPRHDVLTNALLLDRFPAESVERLKLQPLPDNWQTQAPVAARAAFLISVANVLVPDCTREWFQEDPLVISGRAALPEFAEAPFGRKTSLTSRFELNGPEQPLHTRQARAVATSVPREQWDWHEVAGLEYKDSGADVRPGDPPISMRFAFTWDADALHLHVEVTDAVTGYTLPPEANRFVELFLDVTRNGLLWLGSDDYQFYFTSDGRYREWFHQKDGRATIKPTAQGYSVDAVVPWSSIQVTPRVGLEIGVSPAVMLEGNREWQPALKLNWCYQRRVDGQVFLGNLRLE